MDWNRARPRRVKRGQSVWSADDTTSTYWQRGGSALLADLVEETTEDLPRNGSARFSVPQTTVYDHEIWTVKNGRLYGIKYTSRANFHSASLSDVDQIFSSFEFI
jgi:hypothetical protein